MVAATRFFLALLLFITAACAKNTTVRDFGTFDPKIHRDALYIVPFNTTLIPPDVGEPVFNEFVDILNSLRQKTNIANFVIMKEDLKEIEPAWLVKQSYMSGDVWGFVESSGCCSTEMKLKSRIYLYEAGKTIPSLEISVPVEDFFEHDRMSKTNAKMRLSKKLAQELANAILSRISY